MDTTSTLTLDDGHVLSWATYGDPDGRPAFYFHGLPGSRLQARTFEAHIDAAGLAVVAPERPGFGRSSFQAGRRVVDWPADVAAIADHLGIDRFLVFGVSGGGPYTLAVAALLGDRVLAAASIVGGGDMSAPDAFEGMHVANQGIFVAARDMGYEAIIPILEAQLKQVAAEHSEADTPASIEGLPEADVVFTKEHPEINKLMGEDAIEALAAGAEGVAYEAWLALQPLDFDPATITVPVSFWHGEADGNVPVGQARRMAAIVPGAKLTVWPGVGHLGFFDHMDEILADLVASAR